MTNDPRLQQVMEFARLKYESLDDAHGVEHGERVVASAKKIAALEGGAPFLVEAGAWLHQYHDDLEELLEGLKTMDLTGIEIESLYHIVEVCRPHNIDRARSLEAKIVFDADGLDLIGPFGNIRELLCNLNSRGKSLGRSIKDTIDVERIFLDKLQTETAKSLAERFRVAATEFWESYEDYLHYLNV